MDSFRLSLVIFHKSEGEFSMSLDRITEVLKTLCLYNTVNITHTFSKNEETYIKVECLLNTNTLAVNCYPTQEVLYFDSIEDASAFINNQLNSNVAS